MSFGRMMGKVAWAALGMAFLTSDGMTQSYLVQRIGRAPRKGYDEIHLSRAAIAGQQIRIWWATLLNPDCTPAGTMNTQILTPPNHGHADISDEPFYPNYVEPNPRAVCDAQKVVGKQAFYTSAADFHGHDKIVLQNATSEGRMRRITVDIDVR